MELGKFNQLKIDREQPHGLYLTDAEGESILLPRKYVSPEMKEGDEINVFIYRDNEERLIATTLNPKINLFKFANLEVMDVNRYGAFMDWGLEKQLFVPFSEQNVSMKPGQWHTVYLYIDKVTNRLLASAKINKFLDQESIKVNEGDEVEILLHKDRDIGFEAIINHSCKGMLFKNEIFQPVKVGQTLTAFIKNIREDGKIDLSLNLAKAYQNIDPDALKILEELKNNDGFLPFHDKSEPEKIKSTFGISKKAFKRAIGSLYKARKISLEKNGIRIK